MKLTIALIGHLGKDAEIRQVGDSCAIGFSVACTKKYKDRNGAQQQETTWINCTIWRKPNETTIAQYLKKGTQVYIEGEPAARAYVTAQQTAAASLECRVDKVELLGSPQGATQGGVQAPVQGAAPVRQQAPVQQQVPHANNPANFTKVDDDLPF